MESSEVENFRKKHLEHLQSRLNAMIVERDSIWNQMRGLEQAYWRHVGAVNLIEAEIENMKKEKFSSSSQPELELETADPKEAPKAKDVMSVAPSREQKKSASPKSLKQRVLELVRDKPGTTSNAIIKALAESGWSSEAKNPTQSIWATITRLKKDGYLAQDPNKVFNITKTGMGEIERLSA